MGGARRHARVDDPDRVGEQDRGAAGDGARDHRLDGRELAAGAAGLGGGAVEEGPRPLIPFGEESIVRAKAVVGVLADVRLQ